jgi:hypothetical protein
MKTGRKDNGAFVCRRLSGDNVFASIPCLHIPNSKLLSTEEVAAALDSQKQIITSKRNSNVSRMQNQTGYDWQQTGGEANEPTYLLRAEIVTGIAIDLYF